MSTPCDLLLEKYVDAKRKYNEVLKEYDEAKRSYDNVVGNYEAFCTPDGKFATYDKGVLDCFFIRVSKDYYEDKLRSAKRAKEAAKTQLDKAKQDMRTCINNHKHFY